MTTSATLLEKREKEIIKNALDIFQEIQVYLKEVDKRDKKDFYEQLFIKIDTEKLETIMEGYLKENGWSEYPKMSEEIRKNTKRMVNEYWEVRGWQLKPIRIEGDEMALFPIKETTK